MANDKKKNKKNTIPKSSIQKLKESRNGGQIALRGYSYQFLYSCYLVLSNSNPNVSFQLEGMEDIDCIEIKEDGNDINHIQLKYSTNTQNASFLHKVLENFLKTYLLDQNRSFTLVYDFPVAKGHLSKLLSANLDNESHEYWYNEILNIKNNTPTWDWAGFDCDKFLSCLSFEKVEKSALATKIENALIKNYEIATDNLLLFINSIKILCLEKMEQRAYVTKEEIDTQIQLVKFEISKGPQNPAHSWIRKLDYSSPSADEGHSFFEGKKATPADIVSGIPIKRPTLEQDIINSVQRNMVTVIKASSGQGKTTLALQAAYDLQQEYVPYQLICCDNIHELGNIVQYFKVRVQLGEKPLIIIDNLDSHVSAWNHLAQQLQDELHYHYKLLVTTRELDWYNYSEDLSSIRSINIIKPTLEEKDAKEIFKMFKKANQLHSSVTNWKKAWNKIADRQLLIEYVFLLTHGEMLSERIAFQISDVSRSTDGKAKCEILRKVCFADVCGIKLPISNLFTSQVEDYRADFGEIIKSMESEFFVHINNEGGYIEGLHPVRSMHVVTKLHEFYPIDWTASSVIEIARKEDYPVLFSHLPEFDLNKDDFFSSIIEKLWNEKNLSHYIFAIQGLFSGSVMQYYRSNQSAFNDADSHGGLFLISSELCPFTTFKEFDVSLNTLDEFKKILPENENLKYLSKLRDSIPPWDIYETFIYTFCEYLYRKLLQFDFLENNDIPSYAVLSEWLYIIDPAFNLSMKFPLDYIWRVSERLSLDSISTLMYISFCGNRETYTSFVIKNTELILGYLKRMTKSYNIYIEEEKNAIHIEYIIRWRDIKRGNEESISRLKYICKTLPIYDLYCSDGLKPAYHLLSVYTTPDDTHKEIPIKNIIMMFHQNLTSLWNKTIMSNYGVSTVAEWLEYWFDVRKCFCLLADHFCACIYKLLGKKALGDLSKEVDQLRNEFILATIVEKQFPNKNYPLERNELTPTKLVKIKDKYIGHVRNFTNQFGGFLLRDKDMQRLAMVNLTIAHSTLPTMQNIFAQYANDYGIQEKHLKLCSMETQSVKQLMMCCSYYQNSFPDEHFNKYGIKDWYETKRQAEREIVERELSRSLSKYSIIFPNKGYTIDALHYYPIIVNNFDMSSVSNLNELLIGCIPFADSAFDYLVILYTNKSGKIGQNSLQIPKRMFFNIKKALESEDYLQDNFSLPYPVDTTVQMLRCFPEKYTLFAESKAAINRLPFDGIAQELWIYSLFTKSLKNTVDTNYLLTELKCIQTNIDGMLRSLEGKLPPEDISQITNTCNRVFDGYRFGDAEFNKFIESFIHIKP